jgi:hypothetical protein
MAAGHIEAFFLKAGDSENDQPNDNGPNACLKGCYNEVKVLWDVRWATTVYTPAFMSQVVADTWVLYKQRAASIIIGAFAKTRIYPLRAPSEDRQYAVGACSAAPQCAEGKKATEINIVAREALGTIAYKSVLTNPNSTVIFQAQQDSSRNLLIRSVAFDVINRTLIVPVQEMKRVVQEQNAAKGIKLGASSIPTESRQNPDSSYGIYCNDELRARARRVTNAKEKKKMMDAASKHATIERNATLAKRKAAAYSRLVTSLRKSPNLTVRKALETHKPVGDLQLVYQHLGFKIANLPSKAAEIFVSLLVDNDKMMSIRSQYVLEELRLRQETGLDDDNAVATGGSDVVVSTAPAEDGKC